MRVQKYKARPVAGFYPQQNVCEVEAVFLDKSNLEEAAKWCGGLSKGTKIVVPVLKVVGDPNGDREKLTLIEDEVDAVAGDILVKAEERFWVVDVSLRDNFASAYDEQG